MIHDIRLVGDTRSSFLIETFGFASGGFQNITTISPFVLVPDAISSKYCFIIKVTPSDASQFMDDNMHLVSIFFFFNLVFVLKGCFF